MAELKRDIKVIAFDLDGTIYNGDQLINGARETVDFFRNLKKEVCFFTNNSSQPRTNIFNKLSNFPISLLETDVYCCSYAAKVYLKEENFESLFVIGSDSLINELSNSGMNIINVVQDIKVDALLIGMDLNFNYTKLAQAYEVLQKNKNCMIVVCNMDSSFPAENGLRKPGCGAIASSILTASGRNFDFMIGKPDPYMLNLIAKDKCVQNHEVLIIGDSYESDIMMANNTNANSILIDASGSNNTRNTITVNSISEVRKIFNKYYV
jgi:4-nitrophenyl phosphatase